MKLALLTILFVFSSIAGAQTITGFLVNGTASNTGPVGATLTIQGSGFGATQGFSTATLNGIVLAGNGVKPVSWSATAVVAVIPNTATSGPVVVKVAGKNSNAMNFNIGAVITGVSPASAPVGNTVTISGKGFGTTAGTVTFNGTSATTSGWTDASITAQVPNGTTAGPIVVTVGSQTSNGVAFTPTPVISSFSPSSGLGGATVTISGVSFEPTQGTSTVAFNGVAATASAWNNTSITVTVPNGGQTGNVVVTVNGVASAGQLFTYTPQITGLSPNPMLASSSVTIQGSNFLNQQGTSTVTFNGVAATVTTWGNNSIAAVVPANVKPGAAVVTVNGASSNGFSYTLPSLYSYHLGYAPDGQVLSANDSVNGSWNYSYDDFGRLATANNSSPQQGFSYSYDEYGNRWKQTLTAGQGGSDSLTFTSATSASTNGNCYRAAGVTNQADEFCYDAQGNLLSDGSGHNFTYDAENRLIQVDGGQTATYIYDGDGWRVQGPNGQYLYDQQGRVITQFDTTGAWKYGEIYVGRRHLATYSNGTTNFLYADWLGSKRVVILAGGDVSQICINLPFGDGAACSGTQSTFSGFTDAIHDPETNLEHTNFRKYSSTHARWTTPDPSMASMNLQRPQSLNRYAYVSNRPVSTIDPTGLDELDDGGGSGSGCDFCDGGTGGFADEMGGDPGSGGDSGGGDPGADPGSSQDPGRQSSEPLITFAPPPGSVCDANGNCNYTCDDKGSCTMNGDNPDDTSGGAHDVQGDPYTIDPTAPGVGQDWVPDPDTMRFLLGGPSAIGCILAPDASNEINNEANQLRQQFLNTHPAYKDYLEWAKKEVEAGHSHDTSDGAGGNTVFDPVGHSYNNEQKMDKNDAWAEIVQYFGNASECLGSVKK